MSKGTADSTWFALVDAERCRLLRCDFTRQGTHHVQEIRAFENCWPRYSISKSMAFGGKTGPAYASPHHYVGKHLQRFASDTVNRLRAECTKHLIRKLTIIAPPQLVGELRRSSDQPDEQFALQEGELMQFSTAALAVHALIRSLVDAEATRRESQQSHQQESNNGEEQATA